MTNTASPIHQERRDALLAAWLSAARAIWEDAGASGVQSAALEPHLRELLNDLLVALDAADSSNFDEPAIQRLREIVIAQAKLGTSANATVALFTTLKRLLEPFAGTADTGIPAGAPERLFERLLPIVIDTFIETRERVIAQQSLSLLELATPVLRVWNRILLLPLVGVVDTARARQFTERLLEAVAQYEALVTIIDVTGVPVLDTSVAQHLMKTIDAARLLGTRVVMTGISPEGAQTLTKLGIRFSDVVSRSSLRAGIAEALFIIGQRIVAVAPAGPRGTQ